MALLLRSGAEEYLCALCAEGNRGQRIPHWSQTGGNSRPNADAILASAEELPTWLDQH